MTKCEPAITRFPVQRYDKLTKDVNFGYNVCGLLEVADCLITLHAGSRNYPGWKAFGRRMSEG